MKIHNLSAVYASPDNYKGGGRKYLNRLLYRSGDILEDFDAEYAYRLLNCPDQMDRFFGADCWYRNRLKQKLRKYTQHNEMDDPVHEIWRRDEDVEGYTYCELIRLGLDDTHDYEEAENLFLEEHYRDDPYVLHHNRYSTFDWCVFLRRGEWHAYNIVNVHWIFEP